MTSLIERLEAAERGTFVLDGEIWCAVNGYEFVQWDGAGCVFRYTPGGNIGHVDHTQVRPYSVSLDAALALAELVLPFWAIDFSAWGPMNRVTLNECDEEWWHRSKHARIETQAKTIPLALCAAILRSQPNREMDNG